MYDEKNKSELKQTSITIIKTKRPWLTRYIDQNTLSKPATKFNKCTDRKDIYIISDNDRVQIKEAVILLGISLKKQKSIHVKSEEFDFTVRLMKKIGVIGTVRNLEKTKRRFITKNELE